MQLLNSLLVLSPVPQLKDLKAKMEDSWKAAAVAAGCEIKIKWAANGQIDGKID